METVGTLDTSHMKELIGVNMNGENMPNKYSYRKHMIFSDFEIAQDDNHKKSWGQKETSQGI